MHLYSSNPSNLVGKPFPSLICESFQVRGYPVAYTKIMSWKKDSAAVGLAGLTPVRSSIEGCTAL